MTRDEVIRLAEQASCGWIKNGTEPALFGENQLERFAALVAAHEREACAKTCKDIRSGWVGDTWVDAATRCAAAIRARGET